MHKTVVAIRHVHFEDLGIFDAVLSDAGYAVRYHDLDADSFATLDPLEPDLLIVLGGPVGVYETEAYRSATNRQGARRRCRTHGSQGNRIRSTQTE